MDIAAEIQRLDNDILDLITQASIALEESDWEDVMELVSDIRCLEAAQEALYGVQGG